MQEGAKAIPKAGSGRGIRTADPPAAAAPSQPERTEVHPFNILSPKQQFAFTFHVLHLLFTVGQKLLEKEEQEQTRGQVPRGEELGLSPPRPRQDCSQAPPDASTQSSQTLGSQLNRVGVKPPDQTYQKGLVEDSDPEDSDDGGVALSGTAFGDLVVRVRGLEGDMKEIEQLGDVD